MNTCQTPTDTARAASVTQRPRFRTVENENGAIVEVALPGVRKDDLKLTLLEDSLRIEASRNDHVPEGWKALRGETDSTRYELAIRLTRRFDGSKATAALDGGVLTVTVPLREEAKPRQIEVN